MVYIQAALQPPEQQLAVDMQHCLTVCRPEAKVQAFL